MRERLLLLSRFPFSPPNPWVSGGLPLLLGGSPHRNGGLPLLRGGFFCSLLSPQPAVTSHSLLRQFQTLTEIHPLQTFKPPPPLSISNLPPSLPSHLLITVYHCRRHLPGSEPFFQNLRAATKNRLTTLSNASGLLCLLSSRSLAGALCHLRTSWLSAPSRPPPKPPPAKQVCILVSTPSSKLFGFRLVFSPSQLLKLLRPPPKPPWLLCVYLDFLGWIVVYRVSMGFWFQVLGFCSAWLEYAQQVFDEIPHRTLDCLSTQLWMFLPYMVIVLIFGDDTFSDDHTSSQVALLSHDKWVNLETISSRIVRTHVKDIIRNWIGRKTIESLSLITTSTWELKFLLPWLFRCCIWADYVLMNLKHSKCIGLNAHSSCVVVYFVVVASSLWFGNVQPLLLHVLLLILLLSFE